MAKRCLHDRKRSHTFKSGEIMWLCLDCGAGGGHYDQSVPSQGKLYRKGGSIEDPEPEVESESVLDTDDPEVLDEIAELNLPTFAALEDENEIVPTSELDGSGEEEKIEEEECVQEL